MQPSESKSSKSESRGKIISNIESYRSKGLILAPLKKAPEKHIASVSEEALTALVLNEQFRNLLRDVVRDVVAEAVDELIEEFDLDARLSLRAEVVDDLNQLEQHPSSYIDEESLRRELGLDA